MPSSSLNVAPSGSRISRPLFNSRACRLLNEPDVEPFALSAVSLPNIVSEEKGADVVDFHPEKPLERWLSVINFTPPFITTSMVD